MELKRLLHTIFGTCIVYPELRFVLFDLEVPAEYDAAKKIILRTETPDNAILELQKAGYDTSKFLEIVLSNDVQALEEVVTQYKDMVMKEKIRQKLNSMLEQYEQLTTEEILRQMEGMQSQAGGKGQIIPVAELTYDLGHELTRVRERGNISILLVSDLVSGLLGGEFVVVAARPSVGKSAFLLSNALRYAREGIPVGIISLEMTETSMLARLALKYVPEVFRHKSLYASFVNMPEETFAVVLNAFVNEFSKYPIFFAKPASNDLIHIETLIRQLVQRTKCKIVFVDYLQLISASGASRVEQVTKISNRLKFLAKSLGIILIVASQLNRESEKKADKRPSLAELRESGAIEQDADVVILLWRPNKDQTGDEISDEEDDIINGDDLKKHREYTVAIVAKQRNGAVGEVELWFDFQMQEFIPFREVKR